MRYNISFFEEHVPKLVDHPHLSDLIIQWDDLDLELLDLPNPKKPYSIYSLSDRLWNEYRNNSNINEVSVIPFWIKRCSELARFGRISKQLLSADSDEGDEYSDLTNEEYAAQFYLLEDLQPPYSNPAIPNKISKNLLIELKYILNCEWFIWKLKSKSLSHDSKIKLIRELAHTKFTSNIGSSKEDPITFESLFYEGALDVLKDYIATSEAIIYHDTFTMNRAGQILSRGNKTTNGLAWNELREKGYVKSKSGLNLKDEALLISRGFSTKNVSGSMLEPARIQRSIVDSTIKYQGRPEIFPELPYFHPSK